ncbi:hypothetical protein H3H36_20575 [Duganella sp. FT3S]|uniref:NHL repeat-containing protein n=1 Tax=Rugamonas fusca TaxID=2758568 RepID=A0A7W2EKV8_9BURK|nr:hypothetical protein [Rugamonas fusca]MBA5607754.1 hypothetical protein [Rugamonas fusca]
MVILKGATVSRGEITTGIPCSATLKKIERDMQISLHTFLALCLVISTTACGGGSGAIGLNSAGTTTPGSNATILAAGATFTMPANAAVWVPAGTTVSSSNGNVITINGSNNTVNTQAGAVVSVPISATGPANNFIATSQSTTENVSTSPLRVSVLAGSATTNSNPVDGTGSSAILWGGGHMVVDASGNIIISDRGSLKKVTQAGVVTTIAPGYQPADWEGIAIDPAGNIYGSGGTMSSSTPVIWGTAIYKFTTAGTQQNLFMNWETSSSNPSLGFGDLATDSKGNLFFLDGTNNRIVKFTSSGTWSVFAGNGASGNLSGIGKSSSAAQSIISGLAIDGNDNLFVNSAGLIQKIAIDETISVITNKLSIDSGAMAIDRFGNIYVVGFQKLYRISGNGIVTSYPFSNTTDHIASMVTDKDGNLYAATRGMGAQIFKISF